MPKARRPTRFIALIVSVCTFLAFCYSSSFGDWSSRSSSSNLAQPGRHIPPKIWQVMFTPPHTDRETGRDMYDFDPNKIQYTTSWPALNPGFDYTLIKNEDANDFVRHHSTQNPDVLNVHFGLRNHGPRSDLMRYLLMYIEGGVYNDTDVTCLKPIDTWIPVEWRHRVKAVVGIEGDSLGGPIVHDMLWDVQFGQWTVAAVPRHRLFRKMIDSVVQRLGDLCELKGTTIDKLALMEIETMNYTAMALWSETIFQELKLITANSKASLQKISDLSGITQPRLYDDILVLPVDYIGSGVPHSGASLNTPDLALVKHHFSGSWRNTDDIESDTGDQKQEEGAQSVPTSKES